MELSSEARIVLVILNSFGQKSTLPTLKNIQTHDIWGQHRRDEHILIEVLNQLVDGESVACTGTTYSLTKQGVAQFKQFMSEGYSALLVADEQSVISGKFCEQVHGLNLCQTNSMSMMQLGTLLEVMNLCEKDYILDLGCGIGRISEYISDVTGARVMGVDFAAGAIERAQERTLNKRGQLSYQVMDLEALSLPRKSFSGIISIEALHFVYDLRKVIRLAKECLQENGRMGFFYSVLLSTEEPHSYLDPEQTPLAEVLKECGLSFQTWDFTEDERSIFEKSLQVAEELRQEYKEEAMLLYETVVSDAKPMLDAIKEGRRRRYFYYIR